MTLKGILAAVTPAAARAVAWAKTVPLLAWAVAGAYLLGGWSCHELARVRVTLAALPQPPEPPPAVDPTTDPTTPDDPTTLPAPTPVPEPGAWHADPDGTADYGWWVGPTFKGRWFARTGVYVPLDGPAVQLTRPARIVGYRRQCNGVSCPTVVLYDHTPPAVPPPGGAFAGP